MTLQPPQGYGHDDGEVLPPTPINPAPAESEHQVDVAPGLQPDSPANVVMPDEQGDFPAAPQVADVRRDAPHRAQPNKLLTVAPIGLPVVGGERTRLRKAAALDRIASGYGYLTVSWNVRQQGLDLVALQEGSSVAVRGHTLAIDLSQPMGRVLVGTGTRGTMPLAPSDMVVSNGATQLVVPILGGTSLGFWPRLTITRVDEFVVVRHELDALSGILGAVAEAYGYDERTFVLASTT